MKNYLVFVVMILLASACANTQTGKVKNSPAGNWDYAITNTPEGDFVGELIITTEQNTYSGKLTSSGNELVINNFKWDAATQKVTGDFYYTNLLINLDASLSGEMLNGTVTADGSSFSFKAARKK